MVHERDTVNNANDDTDLGAAHQEALGTLQCEQAWFSKQKHKLKLRASTAIATQWPRDLTLPPMAEQSTT